MGKIIRNGIEFCGTSDTADNIIYDNKDSGLESTTTQGAIDELSEKVKSGGNIEYLTQAQYDALPDDKLTNDVEYRITDAGTMAGAENVGYNNSKSGIEAVNVQDAIDKLDESLSNLDNNFENQKYSIQAFSESGESFNNDLLHINFDDINASCHKSSYFAIASVDDMNNNWLGLNDEMKNIVTSSGGFIGYREVYYRNKYHVMVKLTEMYPSSGRTWTNFFNYSDWTGWNVLRNS